MLRIRNSKGFIAKRQTGFTLIELLIVITMIGILSVFFINTASANLKRARDARRKSDLELIRSGIETYRADCNTYPASITFGGSLVGSGNPNTCLATNVYINNVPQDPQVAQTYVYSTTGNGTTYQICAALEAPPAGAVPVSCNGGQNTCGGLCNYQVINP